MKTCIFLMLFVSLLRAQSFTVEKVSGKVYMQKGLQEELLLVQPGMTFDKKTMLTTSENSSVSIKGDNVYFTLKPLSALYAQNVRKMSIDDLLLALAMEEVLRGNNGNTDGNIKNTAIYGEDTKSNTLPTSDLGIKLLEGALALSESGFKESSALAAREAFRKFPATRNIVKYRLFLANQLFELGVLNEALSEYQQLELLRLSEKEKSLVRSRKEELSAKLTKTN